MKAQPRTQRTASPCDRCETAATYIRKELSAEEVLAFEAHLATCPTCSEAVRDLTEVADRLENCAATRSDVDISGAVLARIPDSKWVAEPVLQHEIRSRVVFFPVLYRVAALFAVVLCGIGIIRYLGRPEPTAPRAQAMSEASAWLAASQEPSGAWNPAKWQGRPEFELSLTGMALLTLLGLNQADAAAPYAQNIERAVVYILAQQREQGNFGPISDGTMYNHGIATVAMLEALAATDDPALIEPIGRALSFIRDRQLDSGGWGYGRGNHDSANTSVSVWQLQALARAGQLGQWDVVPTFHRGLLWLQSMVGNDGLVGYRRPSDFPDNCDTLTAMAAACLLPAGSRLRGLEAVNNRMRAALRSVASNPEQATDFYHSYFLASALDAAGGDEFDSMLAGIQDTVLDQRVTSGANAGSWDTVDHWSSVGGRIYTTSMAALSLSSHRSASL